MIKFKMKQKFLIILVATICRAAAQVAVVPTNPVATPPLTQPGAPPSPTAVAQPSPGAPPPSPGVPPASPVVPPSSPVAAPPLPAATPAQPGALPPPPGIVAPPPAQPKPVSGVLPQSPAPVPVNISAIASPNVNVTSPTTNGTLLVNSTAVQTALANNATLLANVTAPATNQTIPLKNLTQPAYNVTNAITPPVTTNLPIQTPNNRTQTNTTSAIANHVNVMSVDPVNISASQNGTLLSLNEIHALQPGTKNNVTKLVVANSTVAQLNTTTLVSNSTTLIANTTEIKIGANMTISLNNSTESVILGKTMLALNTAATNTYRLIQDVSNEISWIQTHLPLRSNNLTISISEICRRIRELFLDTSPQFASYYIADLQHFSATVEKLVATIGKNISELYEDFSQTVTLHIMNTTTLIADTATNISRMLKNATESAMTKVCINRLTPQVMAYGEHYINILGACSTDQEARVKAIASNTMITCSSLFAQGLEIVKKLNGCMDRPSVSVNASRVCVTDVCSQLQLAALNIEMDALMIQAGITFDIETLRDRVTYCSLMRSVEATNKANILMQMSSLCLAGRLK